MYNIYEDLLTPAEVAELLEFHNKVDHTSDNRPDCLTKHPVWDQDEFPQEILARAMDKILEPYTVDKTIFYTSFVDFRLHVDLAYTDINQPVYKNLLFALAQEGYAGTVIFDNYWPGLATRFTRTKYDPFEYSFDDKNGNRVWIKDIRELYQQCIDAPHSVEHFDVTAQFVKELAELIETRQGPPGKGPEPRTSDYSKIINWDPNKKFDPDLHEKYLKHVPIEDLHGLTILKVIDWKPGMVFTFDRRHIHCAAYNGATSKTGIVMTTSRLTKDNNPV